MQLTKHTDYSLRVLIYLALDPSGLGTITDIADRYGISKNHLVKIVHKLAKLGYVESVQGRGGGVRLGMPADEISVGDIVRAMENSLKVIDCVANNCPLLPACRLRFALDRATVAFLDVLDEYTIADAARNRHQLLRLIGGRPVEDSQALAASSC